MDRRAFFKIAIWAVLALKIHAAAYLPQEHLNEEGFEVESLVVYGLGGQEQIIKTLFSDELSSVQGAESDDPYYKLPLKEGEKKIIHKIIATMAEKNVFQLGLERKNLKIKGEQINHIHPMRFIGYIFSDHQLKSYMRQIRKNSFKWDGFIEGFSRRMKEEAKNSNLDLYIPGFAHSLNVSSETIMKYISSHNWEGLVLFLLRN